MMEGIHPLLPSTPGFSTILESLVSIHAACILNDHMMATFIPPLRYEEMETRWKELAEEAGAERRLILVYISKVASRSSTETVEPPFAGHPWLQLPCKDQGHDLEVSGVVSLSMPKSQTGPFRGSVQNMFVSPFHRRKHIATALLAELERTALSLNRWSLMLDTVVGLPAERMYAKLGYETLGTVRAYGFSPKDHSLVDEIFFWKDLRKGTLSEVWQS